MAWQAVLKDVNVGANSVSVRVEVTNDTVLIEGKPLTFSISRGFTTPSAIDRTVIVSWVKAEITRIKNLYDKAQTLNADIGIVITP